jgi:hypothetical protein
LEALGSSWWPGLQNQRPSYRRNKIETHGSDLI